MNPETCVAITHHPPQVIWPEEDAGPSVLSLLHFILTAFPQNTSHGRAWAPTMISVASAKILKAFAPIAKKKKN